MERGNPFIDPITGIFLSPGFHGENCPDNGNTEGQEYCCDECDYYLICFPDWEKMIPG